MAFSRQPHSAQQDQNKARLQDKTSREENQARIQAYMVKEIRHQLILLLYYNVFDWLEGEVSADGKVTLRGQVVRPTTKTDAEQSVRQIEGVEEINNEIEILPVSPNDDRIRRSIFRAFFNFNSPLFRYATQAVPPIHIIVKNGRVILKGVVANKMDSQIANMKANGVGGVFEVTNELQIEK